MKKFYINHKKFFYIEKNISNIFFIYELYYYYYNIINMIINNIFKY